jgi:hypothetical protein
MSVFLDRLHVVALLVGIGALAAIGCGSGAPYAESSLTEATVSGHVTSEGQPVTKGQVIFDPANVNRPRESARTAEIRKDGTYEVKTLIGENRVTVAIPGRSRKKAAPYVQQIFKVETSGNTLDIPVP